MSEVKSNPTPVDYPTGDGKPDCTLCKGRGVIRRPPSQGVIVAGELLQPCPCVRMRDILNNAERGWRGLTQAVKIPESILLGKEKKSLWVTGTNYTFKAHLRYVALRNGPNWGFVVVSDADLMDSWLARVDDKDVYDGDVSEMRKQPVTSKYGALVDLTEPPELLIVVTGVKAARNSAMPEVMLEVLLHREHIGKPTWIVDQPGNVLGTGHMSFDSKVGDFLSGLPHIKLKKLTPPKERESGTASTEIPMMRRPLPPKLEPEEGMPSMIFSTQAEPEVEEESADTPEPPRKQSNGGATRSEMDSIQATPEGKKFKSKWKGGKG